MFKKNQYVLIVFVSLLMVVANSVAKAQDLKFFDSISLTAGIPGDLPTLPSIAYNSKKDEYLVVYSYEHLVFAPKKQVHGALLSAKGKYLKNFIISDQPYSTTGPQVAYDSDNDRYLVCWGYDAGDDGNNWDLHGRFILTNGPDPNSPSFSISQEPTWNEMAPRVVFRSDSGTFVVAANLLDIGGVKKVKIVGYEVSLGAPISVLFEVSDALRNLINPDIAYNPYNKEFVLVYSDLTHIYARNMNHLASFPSAEKNITNLASPLAGAHDNPSVSYLQDHGAYVVLWNTDKGSGNGRIYAGLFGANDFANSIVYTVKVDGDATDVRPDFYPEISCQTRGNDCLTTWVTVNTGTFFTFGRLLRFGSTPLLQPASPFDNLGSVAGWGVHEPRLGMAAGRKNFMLSYGGIPLDNIMRVYARPTYIPPFPWAMILQNITSNKK